MYLGTLIHQSNQITINLSQWCDVTVPVIDCSTAMCSRNQLRYCNCFPVIIYNYGVIAVPHQCCNATVVDYGATML